MSLVIPDVLLTGLARLPDQTCLVEHVPHGDNRHFTFRELDQRIERLRNALLSTGLKKGDRVALLAFNEIEYMEVLLACQRGGWISVPLNFRSSVPELKEVLAACNARWLIASRACKPTAEQLGLGLWVFGDEYEALLKNTPLPESRVACYAPELPVMLLGTSGTTGTPKLVTVSNGCLWARMIAGGIEHDVRAGDMLVNGMPMFHAVNNYACAWLFRGSAMVQMPGFDPDMVIDVLQEQRGTHVMLVPTVIGTLVSHPRIKEANVDSLRVVSYGAAPISPEVLKKAMQVLHCDFLQVYGMTETTSLTMLRPADHDPVHRPEILASSGIDAISFETRIVDAEDNSLPPGKAGEIVVRGPCVMDGYWGQPEATADAMRGGWFHTGDIGYKDAKGYLYIVDRLKDIIVSGAENVASREVEDVLYGHPAVREVAVIGVPDTRWGERVHAVVVCRAEPPDPVELMEFCRSKLAGYKIPKSIEFVAELPKNPVGKIMKRELRRKYWGDTKRQIG